VYFAFHVRLLGCILESAKRRLVCNYLCTEKKKNASAMIHVKEYSTTMIQEKAVYEKKKKKKDELNLTKKVKRVSNSFLILYNYS